MRPAFFRQWEADENPLVIIGGLVVESNFTASEIDSLTIDDARFWWNAIAAYRVRVKEAQEE